MCRINKKLGSVRMHFDQLNNLETILSVSESRNSATEIVTQQVMLFIKESIPETTVTIRPNDKP